MRLEPQDAMPARSSEASGVPGLDLLISLSNSTSGQPVRELPPAPAGIPGPGAARQAESPPGAVPRRSVRIHPATLLLPVILALQAYLSLQLVWSNTAYQDEALYLWAGRLEWQHWLTGAPIPPLPTYFSGAPVLYPPLGAAADALGGLAGARILSLAFMLAATILLWAATTRLLSRRAAVFACAAWVVLGPVQRLGAFATYDAMSLFLLSLAAWCAVRAARCGDSTRWLLAAAVAALLANAAKYASAIFDPVIVVLAGLAACPRPGWRKEAAARWAAVLTYLGAGVVGLGLLAGHSYISGIDATTLARAVGQQQPLQVLGLAWQWTGVVIAAAAGGVLLAALGPRRRTGLAMLLALLLLATLLVPAEQARIHSTTSLDKHVAFGAWFGAIAAGYAADRLAGLVPRPRLQALLAGVLIVPLLPAAAAGMSQARQFFAWPDSAPFIRVLRPLAEHSAGPMLVETSAVPEYYLPGIRWQRWSNTFSITTMSGLSRGYSATGIADAGQPAVYLRYIRRRYFDIVALDYSSGATGLDGQVTRLLRADHAYRVVATVPYGATSYTIWRRVPGQARRPPPRHGRAARP